MLASKSSERPKSRSNCALTTIWGTQIDLPNKERARFLAAAQINLQTKAQLSSYAIDLELEVFNSNDFRGATPIFQTGSTSRGFSHRTFSISREVTRSWPNQV
jgi:hypothetical protein